MRSGEPTDVPAKLHYFHRCIDFSIVKSDRDACLIRKRCFIPLSGLFIIVLSYVVKVSKYLQQYTMPDIC